VLRSGVNSVAVLLLVGTVVLGVLWLGRQIQRAVLRQTLDAPKYLLLRGGDPDALDRFADADAQQTDRDRSDPNIYHNLQYHRLIWFHNQKYVERGHPGRMGTSPTVREGSVDSLALKKKYGPAELISRRLLYYVSFGILFGLLYQGPRQILGYLGLKAAHGVRPRSCPCRFS